MASPTSRACDSTSVSNSVLPTMSSVRRDISRGHVQRRAVGPAAPHAIRVRHHRRRVRGDAVAVKRGLHQAALPEMNGVLARQQPLAEQTLRPFETTALVEVLVVRDEHVLDDRWIAGDEQVLAAHPQVGKVAVRRARGPRRTASGFRPGLYVNVLRNDVFGPGGKWSCSRRRRRCTGGSGTARHSPTRIRPRICLRS